MIKYEWKIKMIIFFHHYCYHNLVEVESQKCSFSCKLLTKWPFFLDLHPSWRKLVEYFVGFYNFELLAECHNLYLRPEYSVDSISSFGSILRLVLEVTTKLVEPIKQNRSWIMRISQTVQDLVWFSFLSNLLIGIDHHPAIS